MYYHERIPEIAYSEACMGKEPHGTTWQKLYNEIRIKQYLY